MSTSLNSNTNSTDFNSEIEEESPLISYNPNESYFKKIQEKINFTNFHFFFIITSGFIYISSGISVLSFNILIPLLLKIFNLKNTYFLSIITGIFFTGYLFGTFCVGYFCRIFGRRKGIIFCFISLSILSLLIPIFKNLFFMLLIRFLFGYFFGLSIPQVFSNIYEMIPNKWYKDFCIYSIFVIEKIGFVYYILMYKHFVQFNHNDNINWKIGFLLSAFPCLITLFLIIFFFKDSLQLLINLGRINDLEETINYLFKLNNQNKLTNEEVYLLEQESISINNSKELNEFSYSLLFSSNYLKTTIICILIVLLNDLSGYTNIYSSPLIFAKFHEKNDPAIQLLYTHIITIPAYYLTLFVQNYLGRKKTFIFGLVFCGISAILPIIFNNKIDIIILSSCMINFFNIFSSLQSRIIIMENYPTKLRDIALATVYAITKIGLSITPLISSFMLDNFKYGSFIQISLLSFLGVISILFLNNNNNNNNYNKNLLLFDK